MYRFAIAASSANGRPASFNHAARWTSVRPAEISVAMSARWNWIAWNEEIGLPNCSRSFEYASARSYAPCARPTPIAATEMRPPSRISRNWRKPSPRAPRRFSSGTSTFSNESSRVSEARQPSFFIGAETV